MSIVLGIHTGHDGTVAVVKDGKLVAALSLERLSRERHCYGVDATLIDIVLAEAGGSADKVDAVALSDWSKKWARGTIDIPPDCTWSEVFDNDVPEYATVYRGRAVTAYNVGHHLCHCAAAYYTSPFTDAACLSMDASGGPLTCSSLIAHGRGNKLTAMYFPGLMIGLAYGFFCEWLGLGNQQRKAGAMMGLASYGKVHQRVRDRRDEYVKGCFFGEGGDYRKWTANLWKDIAGTVHRLAKGDSDEAMDIAATMQWLFEEAIIECVRNSLNDIQNICLGGGSFLNCNANSRVRALGKNVHLFPASSDDGGAVGAALYVAHHILGEKRHAYTPREIAYLGPKRPENTKADLQAVARLIADGKVVGWFQGRSECGPRALGNRSILADPRSPSMRDHINKRVKHREWFRPLAPSVLYHRCAEFFAFDGESPYMMLTAKVKEQYARLIPAVTHVDGTARMQTVTREMNPVFYDLIAEFETLTGIPMVLNTSLNGQGQPMAETEEHAQQMLADMELDALVIGGEIVTK